MSNGLNVLSLFDGMSCGMVALQRAGIKINKYFASEIDKYAIEISNNNYPQILRLGDITKCSYRDGRLFGEPDKIPLKDNMRERSIDLIIGGSPCTSFSNAGKREGFEGASGLFREYIRILKEVKPKYFLLENVRMKKEWMEVITNTLLEIYPDTQVHLLNSAAVSGQNRRRNYRTNIPGVTAPEDKGILLKDILEDEVDEKYYVKGVVLERYMKDGHIKNYCEKHDKAYPTTASMYKGYGNDGVTVVGIKQINKPKHIQDRVYGQEGKAPTLNAMGGGNRQPKIITNLNPSGRGMNGNVYDSEQKSPTLTTNKGEGVKIIQRGRGFNKGGEHYEKSPTLSSNSGEGNNHLYDGMRIRKLTPLECERLQTLPNNYTAGVSDTQRYKMIGNGRTVDIISHILSFIPH